MIRTEDGDQCNLQAEITLEHSLREIFSSMWRLFSGGVLGAIWQYHDVDLDSCTQIQSTVS